jgi:hypothetical protein
VDARGPRQKLHPRAPLLWGAYLTKSKYRVAKTEISGHGRSETRVAVVVEAKGLAQHHEFPGLAAFGRIEATRVIAAGPKPTCASLCCRASCHHCCCCKRLVVTGRSRIAWAARCLIPRGRGTQPQGQWSSKHRGYPPPALDIARLDQSKGSLTAKLKRAEWNDEFMLKMLSQMR